MSKTLHLRANDPADVAHAARLLSRGGLVAFPTETVYGLGANALSAEAVAGIFRAKSRPAWDPLIVHVPSAAEIGSIALVEGEGAHLVQRLADAFWPGPLTLLLPRRANLPDAVTAGRLLVGVRVPRSPVAQQLLRLAGLPIAAPSANRFGHTSPTTAEHVLADLEGKIDAVLDGGPCAVGVESTVLDPATRPITIYRAGAITADQIAHCCCAPTVFFAASERSTTNPSSLASPGIGIRHYAPQMPLHLVAGTPAALGAAVQELGIGGARVGVLLPADWPVPPQPGVVVERWGPWSDLERLAALLFAGLRALEASGAAVLVAPLPEAGGLGDALRDRLQKAARPA